MRVGIITYHFAINYGALLQCYALQCGFENRGVETYVVDYANSRQKDNNLLYSESKNLKKQIKNLLLLPFHLSRNQKYSRFKSFYESKLNTTISMDSIASLSDETKNFDAIVSGSDQVFNPQIDDFCEAFVLPFKTKTIKASYAASLGSSTDEHLLPFTDWIKDFDFITVREPEGVNYLNKLGVDGVQTAPDPVFLLGSDRWKKLSSFDRSKKEKPYLLCYFLNDKYTHIYIKRARRVAAEKGLELINIVSRYRPYNFGKGSMLNVGPEEFLGLFMSASYVCTDSFHGTAFSVMFEVDFTCFCPERTGNDRRKQEILNDFGLTSRISYADDDSLDMSPVDFSVAERRLVEIKNRGYEVIDHIINLARRNS